MSKNRKSTCLVFLVLLVGLGGNASATVCWDTPEDSNWNNPNNWEYANGTGIPGFYDHAGILGDADVIWPVIDSNTVPGPCCNQLRIGYAGNTCRFEMAGGTLTTAGTVGIGYYGPSQGIVSMSGGLMTVGGNLLVGYRGDGMLNMEPPGGTINVAGTLYIPNDSQTPDVGIGQMHLNAGLITCNDLVIGETGTLDIKKGTLIIDGDKEWLIYLYMAHFPGCITGYGISGDYVLVDYNPDTDKTTVTATACIPYEAYDPSPADKAENVDINVVLSFSAGRDASSHDVYFGTSFNDVNDANNSWPVGTSVYKGNQPLDANSYDPWGLKYGRNYYWRVDEAGDFTTWKGKVWKFTTKKIKAPAFPGAEGAGKWTVGGRGGRVIEVTNLNDSGPGSLRAALGASGARIVVFRVSGNIELQSQIYIGSGSPYLTVAGQTAPGDGICIKNHMILVSTHDVVIRYLRSRPGDNAGIEVDAIRFKNRCKDIIVDHCSFSWAVDETVDVSTTVLPPEDINNVTVQWCMITESLDDSVHPKGHHGCGVIAKGGFGNEMTFHHNLLAHHESRSPYPGNYNDISVDPDGLTFDFRNNVIYNWARPYAGYNTQSGADSVTRMNFVGNYYKRGPDSVGTYALFLRVRNSRGYLRDNWMDTGYPGDPWSLIMWDGSFTQADKDAIKLSSPVPVTDPIAMDDAQTAYQRVLADAGATLPRRDPVDVRVINDVIKGTGGIINDEADVGGWPVLASGTPPTDTDHDGMPNSWELARGLNPNDAGDGAEDGDGDGYTNVEEYLNYLTFRSGDTPGDFDGDGHVDRHDLYFFTDDWLVNDCDYVPIGNLNGDCKVDFLDFAIMASGWGD